jgi:hypothetical protein
MTSLTFPIAVLVKVMGLVSMLGAVGAGVVVVVAIARLLQTRPNYNKLGGSVLFPAGQ